MTEARLTPTIASGELLAVFVPGKLTNPMNGSHGHWTKHRRWAKAHRDLASTCLLVALGPAGLRNRQRATGAVVAGAPKLVKFFAYVAREWDDDNLRAAIKPVRDALKDMRVIDDDKPSSGHQFTYEQVVDRRMSGQRGVEIRVSLLAGSNSEASRSSAS